MFLFHIHLNKMVVLRGKRNIWWELSLLTLFKMWSYCLFHKWTIYLSAFWHFSLSNFVWCHSKLLFFEGLVIKINCSFNLLGVFFEDVVSNTRVICILRDIQVNYIFLNLLSSVNMFLHLLISLLLVSNFSNFSVFICIPPFVPLDILWYHNLIILPTILDSMSILSPHPVALSWFPHLTSLPGSNHLSKFASSSTLESIDPYAIFFIY